MFKNTKLTDYGGDDERSEKGIESEASLGETLFGSSAPTPTAELETEIDANGQRDSRALEGTGLAQDDFEWDPEPIVDGSGRVGVIGDDNAFRQAEQERYQVESGSSTRSEPRGSQLFESSLDEDIAAASEQGSLDPSGSSAGRVASVSFVRSGASGQMASTDTKPTSHPPGERARRSGNFVPAEDNRLPPGVGRDPISGQIVSKR